MTKLFKQVCSNSLLLCSFVDTGDQYCFILTQRGQYDVADAIFWHIMVLNAYQACLFNWQLSVSIIPLGFSYCLSSSSFLPVACGLAAGQHTAVIEQGRKLITVHQFNNE